MCEQIKCTDEVYLSGILQKFHQSLSFVGVQNVENHQFSARMSCQVFNKASVTSFIKFGT